MMKDTRLGLFVIIWGKSSIMKHILACVIAFAMIGAALQKASAVDTEAKIAELTNEMNNGFCKEDLQTQADYDYSSCGEPEKVGTGRWYDCSNAIDKLNKVIYAYNKWVRECREKKKSRDSQQKKGRERIIEPQEIIRRAGKNQRQ